jgi:hypothetical protein
VICRGIFKGTLGILLALAPLAAPLPAASGEDVPRYSRLLTWKSKSGDQVARGLLLYRTGDDGRKRLFLETPAGNRVLMTTWYDEQNVAFHARLLDEESGWWGEFVTAFPDTAPQPMMNVAEAAGLGRQGQRILNVFSTKDVDSVEVEESQKAPLKNGDPIAALKDRMRALRTERVEPIALPESLVEEVQFLRVLVLELRVSEGEAFQDVLELISAHLAGVGMKEAGVYAPLTWLDQSGALMRMEKQPREALDVARRFKSVSPSDPLEDRTNRN